MMGIDQNPWQREGVSLLPANLAELSPIVGQKRLYEKLRSFRREIEQPGGQALSGFFMVIGGWGVGKSRVGHEICLEAVSDEVDWIVDGKPERLFERGLTDGTLPLFIRYVQVTTGPLGDRLEADNWIPSATVEALARLAGLRDQDHGNKLVRNQDRILEHVRAALKPKGWDRHLPDLQQALQLASPHDAAQQALDVLKRMSITRLWLVMDEIEDITDVQRDGLPSSDRGEGIDQGLLTVIPRVIKAEEPRQEYPEVSFLLLCSLAVGDLLRQIRAIERRTGWHELTANTFSDVNAFFSYLEAHRPNVAEAIATYPDGLKEAAFFAANRNFGWFNVLMHHAHENRRQGTVSAPDLLKKFAETATKGGSDSVFDIGALSPARIEQDADYAAVTRAIYSLLPQEVGSEGGMGHDVAQRFLSKKDHGHDRNLFTEVVEVVPPPIHRVMAHMVASGFRNVRGTELVLMGEARFDLMLVLSGLEAYAIRLPDDRQGHWLICTDETEFTHQVAGLSPYPEEAQQFAPYLHGLLTDPAYLVKDETGSMRHFVAPAFSFLRDFNRLNKTRQDDQGYLRDSARNSRLEEAFREVDKNPDERARRLLHGVANAWEGDAAPASMTWLDEELALPSARWQPTAGPLDISANGHATVLYATGASDEELEAALSRLASRRNREGAEPIVVLFQEQPNRARELAAKIDRLIPSLSDLVVCHDLVRRAGDDLVRMGLLGRAFETTDLRTSHFHAVIGRVKEHLKQTLDTWVIEQLEGRGVLLRPLFFGSKVSSDDIKLFARGFAALQAGRTYHEITQPTSDVFASDSERDRFKKVVAKHVDPGPKYAGAPREALIDQDGGLHHARVSRPFIAFMDRCGGVPAAQKDLERWFVYHVRNDKREEVAKPREVVRTWLLFLEAIGLLQERGNKYARVSQHELGERLKGAERWLEGAFKKTAERVGQVYDAAGAHLTGVDAKSAAHKLKDAKKKLRGLDMDYLRLPWDDLNRQTGDDIPLYAQKLKTTLDTVLGVRDDIHWVYDPAELATFRYNSEALADFEANQAQPRYPLWRRSEVLKGFFDQLDDDRKKLIRRLETLRAEVEASVPKIPSGPDAGTQAFPTQPLTLVLEMYQQELDFSSEHPNKTVAALGTTMGVSTIGYKLVAGHYLEVLDRLAHVRGELFDGGKLVDTFLTTLDRFTELRQQTTQLREHFDDLAAFLVDAPSEVVANVGLGTLRGQVETVEGLFFEGDIRQKTDEREAARHRVTDLLPKLVDDLDSVADHPRQAREAVDGAKQRLLPSLQTTYQSRHAARLNALVRIRKVKGEELPNWPDGLAATWAQTVGAFEAVVDAIDTEGQAFFTDEAETSFEVFVAFCSMDLKNQAIDWNLPENERHVTPLMRKKLLRLGLVS